MIHAVLDTSIFRADRIRKSPAFVALARLLKANKVTLHIPDWVKREVLSQLEEDALAKLSTFSAATRALRDLPYVPELVAFSKDLQTRIIELRTVVREHSGDSLREWLSLCAAVEYPAQPHHLSRVTTSYFAGLPPFAGRKSRVDLPDALIWESVLDISKAHETLHFVTADKRLRSCAQDHCGILAYESLGDFIGQDPCQNALQELDEENVYENSIRAIDELAELDDIWLENFKDVARVEITGYVFRNEEIPTHDNEAHIVRVMEGPQFNFEFADAEYYGIGEIEIPLKVFAGCKVQYKLPVFAYEQLSTGRTEGLDVIELDPFTYSVEEDAELMVLGFVDMQLDTEKLKKANLTSEDLLANILTSGMKLRITDVAVLDWL